MTIANMMQDRAALTAQLDATPTDLSSEAEFKEIFERRWSPRGLRSCRARRQR